MRYMLYEETIDEGSGQSMERLHGMGADSYAEAKAMLGANPRYQGIDCFDGARWRYDVDRELPTNK